MTDDSVSPPSDQNIASPPASPSDQTTPPVDIGQQPVSTWPNSTNLANLPAEVPLSGTQAGDQQSTPSAEPIVPEPPKEEIPPPVPSPEIGQVSETQAIPQETPTPDTTWPDSTKMANDALADSPDLANPTSSSTEPISTISAQSPQIPADSPSSSQSDQSPPSPLPATASASAGSSPPDISPSVPVPEAPPPQVSSPEPSEAAKPPEEIVDTNVQSSDNQAPQVQPEVPKDASTINTEKLPEDLANFKPEPLESPQEAPLANNAPLTSPNSPLDSSISNQSNPAPSAPISFGDLLSSENQTPSTPFIPPIPSTPPVPSTPSPSPSISFGDLIKDIEITPPSIPEAQRPVEQQRPTSPSVSPIPSVPPVSPPNPQPASPAGRPITHNPQPDYLSLRRQKANQVR